MRRTKWPEEIQRKMSFLQEASHVNRSRQRGKGKEPMTTVTSGRNIIALYENANQPMLLAKMLLGSYRWMMARFFTGYSLTWRVKVTKSNRSLFQLAVSKRGTEENGSGLWATPQARDWRSPKRVNSSSPYPMLNEQVHTPSGITPTHHVPTPTATDYVGWESTNTGGPSKGELNFQTNKSVNLDRWTRMFPTPTQDTINEREKNYAQGGLPLTKAVKILPTPRAADFKGSGPRGSKSQVHMEDRKYLCGTVATEESGRLNPDWVEWLMGFPVGWTDIGIGNQKESPE